MKVENETCWFAMRATYRREQEAERLLRSKGINTFIPMTYTYYRRRGQKVRKLVPVVRNLLFAHATQPILQEVKQKIAFLQYITDTRTHKKIIVPDEQMQRFIAVAGTYDEHLLYFHPEDVNLSKGTRVRITGGEFEGHEGVFVKVKGVRDRRVVILVEGVIAVAIATIHPDLIEVIK